MKFLQIEIFLLKVKKKSQMVKWHLYKRCKLINTMSNLKLKLVSQNKKIENAADVDEYLLNNNGYA